MVAPGLSPAATELLATWYWRFSIQWAYQCETSYLRNTKCFRNPETEKVDYSPCSRTSLGERRDRKQIRLGLDLFGSIGTIDSNCGYSCFSLDPQTKFSWIWEAHLDPGPDPKIILLSHSIVKSIRARGIECQYGKSVKGRGRGGMRKKRLADMMCAAFVVEYPGRPIPIAWPGIER